MKSKFGTAKNLSLLKKPISFLSIIVLILFAFITQSNAQSLQRQCVASSGSFIHSNGILVQQTIGQPYFTGGYYSDEISFHPGFQQSVVFNIDKIKTNPNININLYPNPAVYSVSVESPEIINNATLQIVDISGKIMLNKNFTELKNYLINCETWSNGFYFITVSDSKNNKYTSRLIITK
jgi:hypothetical protein